MLVSICIATFLLFSVSMHLGLGSNHDVLTALFALLLRSLNTKQLQKMFSIKPWVFRVGWTGYSWMMLDKSAMKIHRNPPFKKWIAATSAPCAAWASPSWRSTMARPLVCARCENNVDWCMHACICAYTQIFIYTHMIHTHTHIHIHIYTISGVYYLFAPRLTFAQFFCKLQTCQKSTLPASRCTSLWRCQNHFLNHVLNIVSVICGFSSLKLKNN